MKAKLSLLIACLAIPGMSFAGSMNSSAKRPAQDVSAENSSSTVTNIALVKSGKSSSDKGSSRSSGSRYTQKR